MPRASRSQQPLSAPEPLRAVIYCRVSTQEQREEGYSIEAQLSSLTTYAHSRGIQIIDVIEESETAKSSGRPGFSKILELIRSKQANAVIVEKTDRLYRNLRDRVLLDDLGPEIHLVKESTVLSPTSKSHEKFMHDIKLVVAKNYIDNLREETIKGMTEKAKAGLWPSHAPTGYENRSEGSRRVICPVPEVAAQIEHIFRLYSSGDYSFEALSAEAQKIGLLTRSRKPYGKTGIQAMLKNPLYAGIVRWNGIDYPGIHQPIISQALWLQVCAVMEGRNPTKVSRTKSREFIYRGLIRCSACGSLMSPYAVKKSSGLEFVYYACPGSKGCKRVNYREEWISEQFSLMLEELQVSGIALELLRKALRGSFETIHQEDEKALLMLTSRKQKIDRSLEALYLEKLSGDVPAETFERLKAKLTGDLRDVNEALRKAERAKLSTWDQAASFIELASNSAARFKEAEPELKRQMFKAAISNCTIREGKLEAEPEFWFKVLRSGAQITPENPSENDVRTVWLPIVAELLTAGVLAA
jgi:site-specific DNA recombinase